MEVFVCERGCHYYFTVCLVLAVSEVAGIGQVGLADYYASIVVLSE